MKTALLTAYLALLFIASEIVHPQAAMLLALPGISYVAVRVLNLLPNSKRN